MSELDQALEAYLQDETAQDAYYRLILDSDFYIPLQPEEGDSPPADLPSVRPLILTADGKHYLPLFDSAERFEDWSNQPLHSAILSGKGAALITTANMHWAINLGTGRAKELVPEEITHLRNLAAEQNGNDT